MLATSRLASCSRPSSRSASSSPPARGPEHPDATAGANFQLPYRASFLLPHRRAAWIRFAERLEELAAFADGLHPATGGCGGGRLESAGRAASDLTAQVEAV